MLDIEQVEKVMSGRSFNKTSVSKDDGQIVGVSFCTRHLDGMDITCTVNLVKETFRLGWSVPNSINRLETPECSPLSDDEHFNRLYDKLHRQVEILYLNI